MQGFLFGKLGTCGSGNSRSEEEDFASMVVKL